MCVCIFNLDIYNCICVSECSSLPRLPNNRFSYANDKQGLWWSQSGVARACLRMGITTSHLDATTAPQVPVFDISGPVGGVVAEGSKDDSNNKPEQNKGKSSLSQLSCPVKYEEIQRETIGKENKKREPPPR